MILSSKRILVAGDFLFDIYTHGDVKRISPEAPVPVLRICSENSLPGGAGNTVLNLFSLGMEVIPFGRIGDDSAGRSILDHFKGKGIDTSLLLIDKCFITPVKNRLLALGQQLMRVDREEGLNLSYEMEKEIISMIPNVLKNIDLVAISDYAKGFLSRTVLSSLILQSRVMSIPVIVDPKGSDFSRYSGATILKPNLSEAITAANIGLDASLDDVANHILRSVDIRDLVITRSGDGISIFSNGKRKDFPALSREVRDVTGAGDTVLAVFAASIANGLDISNAAMLANRAASVVIGRLGCVAVSLNEIMSI